MDGQWHRSDLPDHDLTQPMTAETMARGAQGDPWVRPEPVSLLQLMQGVDAAPEGGTEGGELLVSDLYDTVNPGGDAAKVLPTLVKVAARPRL